MALDVVPDPSDGKAFDEWLRKVKRDAFNEGVNAPTVIFGHAYDCAGYEDCFCSEAINPYETYGRFQRFCGDTYPHDEHTVPEYKNSYWGRRPEFDCSGFFQCERCFKVYYSNKSESHKCSR